MKLRSITKPSQITNGSFLPLAPILLLLVPLIAMQFTDEVAWELLDFVVAGVLLLALSFSIKMVLQRIDSKRIAWGGVAFVVIVFLLIWVELAVGLFGTPFAGS